MGYKHLQGNNNYFIAVIMTTTSGNNETALYGKPSMDSVGLVIGLTIFYVLIAICAIASNITVLIAIARRLVPRNTVNVFFSSLAVSDLLMVVLSLLDCCAYLNGGWVFGKFTCKIQSLLLEVSFSASTLTLVAVSCERYLLICQPHMRQRSIKNIYHLLAFVWILSLGIASPLLDGYIVFEDIDKNDKTRQLVCTNKGWSTRYRIIYYSTYSMVVYVTPLLVMAFTHWRISRSVRKHHRRATSFSPAPRFFEHKDRTDSPCLTIKEGSPDDKNTMEETELPKNRFHKVLLGSIMQLRANRSSVENIHKRNDRRIKAVRMLFVVTVAFFILWTPFIIMRVVSLSGRIIDSYLYKFSEILVFSSTAVNGFIYAYMSTPFRKAFKAILCCHSKTRIMSSLALSAFNSLSDDNKATIRSTGSTTNKDGACFFSRKRKNSSSD